MYKANGVTNTARDRSMGSVLSFHNLEYAVPVSSGFCKTSEKVIIDGVNGVFKPGMNAIMGPTGSGKTSLLDIIAGRKDPTGLKHGHLLIDGNLQPKNFKCVTGYVVQDDVVMGTLTVKENFMFSANVRLPTTVTPDEKESRVENTLKELGLTHCADTKVGTPFIRGVSGGERKRTNIGMELIIAPSVLFLDEPTTGLDASTSYAVLSLLHRISRKGKTIIFSIHQPRYSIYKLFDTLMLLARGKSVYHGPAEDTLEFFSSIGYNCEEHDNPADFFLDVINGDSTAVKATEEIPESERDTVKSSDTVIELVDQDNQESDLTKQISTKYQASRWYENLMAEVEPILKQYLSRKDLGEELVAEKADYATSFLTQLRYVSKRAALNLFRNPMASVLQIIMMTMMGFIIGVLYFDLEDTPTPGIQNRYGLLFFLIMNQVFSNMPAIELFINERAIFIHENSSGFYRVSAYFFAKMACDIFPMRVIPLCTFTTIVYFMAGLQATASQFFLAFLILFSVSLTAAGICFFFGAAVGIFAIANLFCVITYVFMLIFGGLLVNLDSLWAGIKWIQYLSIFRYGLYALTINEMKDLEFFEYVNGTKRSVGNAGERFMDTQNISYEDAWDFWQNVMPLWIMAIFFFTVCYVMLRRVKKFK